MTNLYIALSFINIIIIVIFLKIKLNFGATHQVITLPSAAHLCYTVTTTCTTTKMQSWYILIKTSFAACKLGGTFWETSQVCLFRSAGLVRHSFQNLVSKQERCASIHSSYSKEWQQRERLIFFMLHNRTRLRKLSPAITLKSNHWWVLWILPCFSWQTPLQNDA